VWKNYYCHLWNLHGFNDVRHKEIHRAEQNVSESTAFDIEMDTEMLIKI